MSKSIIKNTKLSNIKDCILSSHGVFKYIQIKVTDNENNSKVVVRGWKDLEYHKDNYNRFKEENLHECSSKPIGGGRIDIDKDNKKIFVYGYSQSYGQCDHAETCNIVKSQFSDYTTSWSNEGY